LPGSRRPRRRGEIAHPLLEPLRVLLDRPQHLLHGAGQGRVPRESRVLLDGGVYGRLDPGFVPGIGLAGGCLRASLSGCLVSLLLVQSSLDLRSALAAFLPPKMRRSSAGLSPAASPAACSSAAGSAGAPGGGRKIKSKSI
jgi:hypothetical protein